MEHGARGKRRDVGCVYCIATHVPGRINEESWFDSWQRQEVFIFSKTPTPDLRPTTPKLGFPHLVLQNWLIKNAVNVGSMRGFKLPPRSK
jgi:hypothetical protein